MDSLPDQTDDDLIQAFSLKASDVQLIEEMARPAPPFLYSDTMKPAGKRRRRPKSTAVAEEDHKEERKEEHKEAHGKKPRKEVLQLRELREWRRSLGKTEPREEAEEEESEQITGKRPKVAASLEKHLAALRTQAERQKAFSQKHKEKLAAEQQELAQTLKPFPFESPAPTVLISKDDQRRMELHQRFVNRLNTQQVSDIVLEYSAEAAPAPRVRPIPNTFEDGVAYAEAFRPVFVEELKAELSNSLAQAKPARAVAFWLRCRRMTATDVYFYAEVSKSGVLSGCFSSGDVLLCSTGEIGTAENAKFLGICEKERFAGGSELLLHCKMRPNLAKSQQVPLLFTLLYVDSTTTHEREYQMMHMAEFLELKEAVLRPVGGRAVHNGCFLPASLLLNESQTQAVRAALDPLPGFTLIQGPPGTGKTHTLLAILSLLLHKSAAKSGVLVCAPSNAAIDEVVYRVAKCGLIDGDGNKRNDCKLVRLTSRNPQDKARHCTVKPKPEVQALSLEQLALEKLTELGLKEDIAAIRGLREEIQKVEMEIDKAESSNLSELRLKRHHLRMSLTQEKHSRALIEEKRREIERNLLASADVIFTTLSGSGCKQLQAASRSFEFVIIDEACQGLELRTLIPLQYKARRAVLIGDPMQLPAVTFAETNREIYSRSLFERLRDCGVPVVMLMEQYRMVKAIREFPSECCYGGKLVDGVTDRRCPDWLPCPELFFIDLKSSHEVKEEEEKSISNPAEIAFICDLYEHFRPYHGFGLDIGIIAPYRKQVTRIRQELKRRFGAVVRKDIEVNTVDGFQGREKDVIVFSAVRSMDQVGFLADVRRLNVAITRARFALWMVGKMETLQRQRTWAQLLTHIKDKHVLAHAGTFAEIRGIFRARIAPSMAVTEPIRMSSLPKKPQDKRITDFYKMFEKPVPRSSPNPNILELITAREAPRGPSQSVPSDFKHL